MKEQCIIPEILRTANITSLHKKNSKLDLNNYRGIFVSSVIRTILMKIIHNRTYEEVTSSMTDSQIGACKKKSVRNHIFVLNSILSDVLSSVKKTPIDIQIMDFKQMFDSEEVFVSLNSLFEAGVKDDLLPLIYEANRINHIAVKTPGGLTERKEIHNKIMQGDVLGPLVSSNMVDKNIGKVAIETDNVYMYKGKVQIPPLVTQDDTLSISECGYKTNKMNTFLNTHTKLMNLQFGSEKCSKMHVGKRINRDICPTLSVEAWENKLVTIDREHTLKDTYIGNIFMHIVRKKISW